MLNYKQSISILNKNKILIKSEKILSEVSLGRVCSGNVYSEVNYPSANNSAFDGFAVRSSDTNETSKRKEIKFKILKVLAAGDKPKVKYKRFSCIEIMTGAVIPKPFDTIIPVESAKIIKSKKIDFCSLAKKLKKKCIFVLLDQIL